MTESPKGLSFLPAADEHWDISPPQAIRTNPCQCCYHQLKFKHPPPGTRYKAYNTAKYFPSCRLPHPTVERKQDMDQSNEQNRWYIDSKAKDYAALPVPIGKQNPKARGIIREENTKNQSPPTPNKKRLLHTRKERKTENHARYSVEKSTKKAQNPPAP